MPSRGQGKQGFYTFSVALKASDSGSNALFLALDHCSVAAVKPLTESDDRRRLALALLNCIYESQDHTLCKYVYTLRGKDHSMEISFQSLGLEPTDCLSIGYFMAHQSYCTLDLSYCSIGDVGLEALMTQLRQRAETSTVSCTDRELHITGNTITSQSMKLVSAVLQTPILSEIHFFACWLPTQVATNLTYLIEGLSRRSTSFSVALPETVTSEHVHYLVLLLTTCRLKSFRLYNSNVREGMPLIAEALKQTTSVVRVAMVNFCNIGDRGLIDLGQKARTSVTQLAVPWNPFSSSAVKKFLWYQFFSILQKLDIGRPLNREEMVIYGQLNLYRYQTNLPRLIVGNDHAQIFNEAIVSVQNFGSIPDHIKTRELKK